MLTASRKDRFRVLGLDRLRAPQLTGWKSELPAHPRSTPFQCDPGISMSYELARTKAWHASWIHEGIEGVVEGQGLKDCKRGRCKEIELVVFGFEPLETWVETIRSLFTPQLQNQGLPKLPPIFLLLAFSRLTRSKDLAFALFKV